MIEQRSEGRRIRCGAGQAHRISYPEAVPGALLRVQPIELIGVTIDLVVAQGARNDQVALSAEACLLQFAHSRRAGPTLDIVILGPSP